MSFTDAIRTLNRLKHRRIVKDYVVIRAVAATAYMEAMATEDLGIIIQVETDEEYLETFRNISQAAEGIDGMHQIISGIPVQLFPNTTKPHFSDTVDKANNVGIGGLRVKMASPEHLVLLYLEAFREKDRFRIQRLLEVADVDVLRTLLERFDDEEGSLTTRLKEI